ncbi:MAG: anthranilate synthase component I family protein [Bacteroidota bacterium]
MNTHPIHIVTESRDLLADTLTPVGLYLRLRDRYAAPLLLESSDYHSRENSFSFLCFEPMASFSVTADEMQFHVPDAPQPELIPIAEEGQVPQAIQAFIGRFLVTGEAAAIEQAAFFGHANFDAVRHFETIQLDPEKRRGDTLIPDLHYAFYRFVIVINHFNDSLQLIEYRPQHASSRLNELEAQVRNRGIGTHSFGLQGEEGASCTETEFMDMVRAGKEYCQQGEVFQVVFSRRFTQAFLGDEFNVYRALRSINPSPYLFYFDFGNYRLFGSSPEAQLVIREGRAVIHPIAGTYRRSGEDHADAEAARQLAADPKENAEHVMLVDLARNDLSRSATAVSVAKFRETQFFSHVIHLVSEVEGQLGPEANPVQVFADTFPAGTLSGAPKYRALQLIEQHEPVPRNYYGGAIGLFKLNGDLNQAIMIRSFLSQDRKLHFQAGAGIVVDSDPATELQEVNNKLAALRAALKKAKTL